MAEYLEPDLLTPIESKMIVRTCFLITDDPDDHQAFSEALSEISSKTIVLIVLDSEKALELLKSKQLTPNFLFLDLSTNGMRINTFLKAVESDIELRQIPTVVYGDAQGLEKMDRSENVVFFTKDYEYSELRNFLKEFVKPPMDIQ
jgi:PleD family two-component response regulator